MTLQLDALRALRTPQKIAELYHQLGYKAEPEFEPEKLSAEDAQLAGKAAEHIKGVYLLVQQDSLLHVHVETDHLNTPYLRRVAEQFLQQPNNFLLSFGNPGASGDYEEVIFVKPYVSSQSENKNNIRINLLKVNPRKPTQHDRDVLQKIEIKSDTSAQEAHKKQTQAFDVERVTREFYKTYKQLFERVRDTIKTQNPYARIGKLKKNTVDHQESLHAFTQRLLNRIIFLYFIQKKGWLNDDTDFLTHLYTQKVKSEGDLFYLHLLEPLFFEVLNTERTGTHEVFGDIPYLNGSLFEREYPETTVLNMPNSLFDPKNPDSILSTLNSYNFTISESSTLEQDVSLDPEMLGKVFENMMEEEEAKKSGTFYTPRSIVQFMAEETLTRYLNEKTSIELDKLRALLRDDADPAKLTLQEARNIIAHLGKVRVLDPAVGTASMLVGVLNTMIRIRTMAEARQGVRVNSDASVVAGWKREYINHCLYGVDIKPEAIEIGRLRLWLSLVVDAEDKEPLPNLDYKLMAGDGLLETVDGEPFDVTSQKIGLFVDENSPSFLAQRIEEKHELFFNEQNSEKRRNLRNEIQSLERLLFKTYIDERIQIVDREILEIREKYKRFNKKFSMLDRAEQANAKKALDEQNKLIKRDTDLSSHLNELIKRRVKVWDEQEPLPFFLHRVHFAEVMKSIEEGGHGGFDIVIGNPPYVRQEDLSQEYKMALKRSFNDVANNKADLYVYFYNKAINLLKNGGRFAYITPNRFMKTGYGKNLRSFLKDKVHLETLIDFGDLPIFEATTYPLIVIGNRNGIKSCRLEVIPENKIKNLIGLTNVDNVDSIRDKLSNFHSYGRHVLHHINLSVIRNNEVWNLDTQDLMHKVEKIGIKFIDFIESGIYRGLLSGLNEVYVINNDVFRDLINENELYKKFIVPFKKGRNIRRWKYSNDDKYIIQLNSSDDPESEFAWVNDKEESESERRFQDMYPKLYKYLEPFKNRLAKRSDRGKFWWELRRCSYYGEFKRSKIVFADIAQYPRFLWDESGASIDCTAFAIPVGPDKKWLTSLFNSKFFFYMVTKYAPSVKGASFRFKKSYLENIPIVTPSPEIQRKLEEFTDDSRLDEMNQIVYELYGLTPEEIELVEELTAPAFAKIQAHNQMDDHTDGDSLDPDEE
ncbi:Eco57I restriction-modification methylase domain-containing protein [Deinococcus roseus]|uniref:site-specific DNA-methyltransferase (adenine-specific) n=1 Tax=Deinococcus roseus TaxID=392414 RepID=A0ABQ2D6J9_9DEIO|nr:N-6 DNA methylase [Deinococcus roseus]GGJ43182.1 hypothetical protein GCM10008938_31810 [Deinococcus roseus]